MNSNEKENHFAYAFLVATSFDDSRAGLLCDTAVRFGRMTESLIR